MALCPVRQDVKNTVFCSIYEYTFVILAMDIYSQGFLVALLSCRNVVKYVVDKEEENNTSSKPFIALVGITLFLNTKYICFN